MPQHQTSLQKLVDTLQVKAEQDEYEKRPFVDKEGLRYWEAKKLCTDALENYNALLAVKQRAFEHAKTT